MLSFRFFSLSLLFRFLFWTVFVEGLASHNACMGQTTAFSLASLGLAPQICEQLRFTFMPFTFLTLIAVVATAALIINAILLTGNICHVRKMAAKSYISLWVCTTSFVLCASCLATSTSNLAFLSIPLEVLELTCSVAGVFTTASVALIAQLCFGHTLIRFLILVRNTRPSVFHIRVYLGISISFDFMLVALVSLLLPKGYLLQPSEAYCTIFWSSRHAVHRLIAVTIIMSMSAPLVFTGYAYYRICQVVNRTLNELAPAQSQVIQTLDRTPSFLSLSRSFKTSIKDNTGVSGDDSASSPAGGSRIFLEVLRIRRPSQQTPSLLEKGKEIEKDADKNLLSSSMTLTLSNDFNHNPPVLIVQEPDRLNTADSSLESVSLALGNSMDSQLLGHQCGSPNRGRSINSHHLSRKHSTPCNSKDSREGYLKVTPRSNSSNATTSRDISARGSCIKKNDSRVSFAAGESSICSSRQQSKRSVTIPGLSKSLDAFRIPDCTSSRAPSISIEVLDFDRPRGSAQTSTPEDGGGDSSFRMVAQIDSISWCSEEEMDEPDGVRVTRNRVSFRSAHAASPKRRASFTESILPESKLTTGNSPKLGSNASLVGKGNPSPGSTRPPSLKHSKSCTSLGTTPATVSVSEKRKSMASSTQTIDRERERIVLIQSTLTVALFVLGWLPFFLAVLFTVVSGEPAPPWVDALGIFCALLFCIAHPLLLLIFYDEMRINVARLCGFRQRE
ncbi:hypothetical protein BC830DRAFT_1155456 [Chytriomyces sp. MP71]|nr:hypothetical protein BC830DRAFT_1155456 [Chytriomyces sp. MP71]